VQIFSSRTQFAKTEGFIVVAARPQQLSLQGAAKLFFPLPGHTLCNRWQFSLTFSLADEASELVQTLLTAAPSLVLVFTRATRCKSRQRFPR